MHVKKGVLAGTKIIDMIIMAHKDIEENQHIYYYMQSLHIMQTVIKITRPPPYHTNVTADIFPK